MYDFFYIEANWGTKEALAILSKRLRVNMIDGSNENWRVEELIQYFNNAYGMEKEWPKQFEVSAVTYIRCCQAIFNKCQQVDVSTFLIALSPNRGLMFKNVELIIKD